MTEISNKTVLCSKCKDIRTNNPGGICTMCEADNYIEKNTNKTEGVNNMSMLKPKRKPLKYAPRKCGKCQNKYEPTGARQSVCTDCKPKKKAPRKNRVSTKTRKTGLNPGIIKKKLEPSLDKIMAVAADDIKKGQAVGLDDNGRLIPVKYETVAGSEIKTNIDINVKGSMVDADKLAREIEYGELHKPADKRYIDVPETLIDSTIKELEKMMKPTVLYNSDILEMKDQVIKELTDAAGFLHGRFNFLKFDL